MRLAEFSGKRVAIWGFGREGRAALALLRQQFPNQAFTVFCSEAEALTLPRSVSANVAAAAADANSLSVTASEYGDRSNTSSTTPSLHSPAAGETRQWLDVVTSPPDAKSLAAFDIVIKSPGISPYKFPYPDAAAMGVRFTSASAIWFAEHPDAKTICVTGTKGKSTVSALLAHLLRQGGLRVALAGNIGLPLLELMQPEPAVDWWVIELSSFQTRDFAGRPTVALINNLYEEHLDWHATRAGYAADKLAIAAQALHVVVNAQQPELAALAAAGDRSAFDSRDGWHIERDAIWRGAERLLPLQQIPLPGLHNALNVCAALAAIDAAGIDARRLVTCVAAFEALPHRLQTLGERGGVRYVNDSISTTPYATIEALRSLADQRVSVIVGGFDRGLDWQPFVDYVANHTPQAIVTMGANGDAIARALRSIEKPGFALAPATSLSDALARAQAHTAPGGSILLSPGAPSFDQFHDYAERGREFARLAGFDVTTIAQIDGLGIA